MAFMGNGMQGGPQQPPGGGGSVQQMLAGLPPEVRAQVLARMGMPGAPGLSGAPGGPMSPPNPQPQGPPPGAPPPPQAVTPDQGQNQMPGGAPAPAPRFEDLLFQNTEIPHEVKLQIMAARDAGNPQAMNEILFNSPMAHDLKLQLSQMAARPMPSGPPGGGMSNRPGHRGGQTARNAAERAGGGQGPIAPPNPGQGGAFPQVAQDYMNGQAPPSGGGQVFGGPSGRSGPGGSGDGFIAGPPKQQSQNTVSNTRGQGSRGTGGGGIGKITGAKITGTGTADASRDEVESEKPKREKGSAFGSNYGDKLKRRRGGR